MTFQVILDSRLRGNDRCYTSPRARTVSFAVPLLLILIVLWPLADAIADSTAQAGVPSGAAVRQSESTPGRSGDSVMLDVYKALLEDQRNITDKMLANQQSNFTNALAAIGIVVVILAVAAGFVGFGHLKRLEGKITSRFDQRLQVQMGDTDRFVSGMSRTDLGDFLRSSFFLMPKTVEKKRENYMNIVWAFSQHVEAIHFLRQIGGNTPSLRGLYLRNLASIEECLSVVPSRNMYQRAVEALRVHIETLRSMPLWKTDDDLKIQMNRVEAALRDEGKASPFDAFASDARTEHA